MEIQIPASLQLALYLGSGAVAVIAVASIVLLLQVRTQVARVAQVAEDLEAELVPLADETRVLLEEVRDLTRSVEEKWAGVESVIGTTRRWSRRAGYVTSVAGGPSTMMAGPGADLIREGIWAFAKALFNRRMDRQQKARES